ncbi:hypothetical protein AVEN_137503-1 [Araneus ventricosus]|uniref:Uncharacterized protein n=1 Tax=Araneus ventricosus TaxID=182803 RepID=A0A4Y2I3E7_ARAVE|nr:hypothetical protein AVEN_137503-1 [Araneus ventricosus]
MHVQSAEDRTHAVLMRKCADGVPSHVSSSTDHGSKSRATRGLWDGPRNFEHRSDDGDSTSTGTCLSKLPYHTNGWACGPLRMIERATVPINYGSSVESGFEPGTLRPQGRYLTTRPPRPEEETQIEILVCSKVAASLARQECRIETSLQQVNASFEVTTRRTCSKLATSNSLQT